MLELPELSLIRTKELAQRIVDLNPADAKNGGQDQKRDNRQNQQRRAKADQTDTLDAESYLRGLGVGFRCPVSAVASETLIGFVHANTIPPRTLNLSLETATFGANRRPKLNRMDNSTGALWFRAKPRIIGAAWS